MPALFERVTLWPEDDQKKTFPLLPWTPLLGTLFRMPMSASFKGGQSTVKETARNLSAQSIPFSTPDRRRRA